MKYMEQIGDGEYRMGVDRPDVTVKASSRDGRNTDFAVETDFAHPLDIVAKIDTTDPELVGALAEVVGEITDAMRTDVHRIGRYTLQLGTVYTVPGQFGRKNGQEAVLRVEPPITPGTSINALAFGHSRGFNATTGKIEEIAITSEATLFKVSHDGLGEAALSTVMERLGSGLNAIDNGDFDTLAKLVHEEEPRFEN